MACDGTFPNPHGNNADTIAFGRQFGLTTRETVVLLGAHSLGNRRFWNNCDIVEEINTSSKNYIRVRKIY